MFSLPAAVPMYSLTLALPLWHFQKGPSSAECSQHIRSTRQTVESSQRTLMPNPDKSVVILCVSVRQVQPTLVYISTSDTMQSIFPVCVFNRFQADIDTRYTSLQSNSFACPPRCTTTFNHSITCRKFGTCHNIQHASLYATLNLQCLTNTARSTLSHEALVARKGHILAVERSQHPSIFSAEHSQQPSRKLIGNERDVVTATIASVLASPLKFYHPYREMLPMFGMPNMNLIHTILICPIIIRVLQIYCAPVIGILDTRNINISLAENQYRYSLQNNSPLVDSERLGIIAGCYLPQLDKPRLEFVIWHSLAELESCYRPSDARY
eukprot:sb/3466751/